MIFEVPEGSTGTEARTFRIVRDGVVVGGPDQNKRIGSYFADLNTDNAWHVFEVLGQPQA